MDVDATLTESELPRPNRIVPTIVRGGERCRGGPDGSR
jgi:hypothetical protein